MLRNVELDDIEIFYNQEADPVANAMAAFPARDRTAHAAHWQKLLADDSNVARTIVEQGQVAGYIGTASTPWGPTGPAARRYGRSSSGSTRPERGSVTRTSAWLNRSRPGPRLARRARVRPL